MVTSINVPTFKISAWDGLVNRPKDWFTNVPRSMYALYRDVPLDPRDQATLGLFDLRAADFWVQGQMIPEKLKVASGLAGQRHAERANQLNLPSWIPPEWAEFSPLIFAGTVWLGEPNNKFLLPCLVRIADSFGGDYWAFEFLEIGHSSFYFSKARLVRVVEE